MQQMFFIADIIACSTCFGAPLCPSSGARVYYTVGCRLWSLVLWFSSCRYSVWSWGLCVRFAGCCWASNKICNKNHLLHLVGISFPHINDDARSKSFQIYSNVSVFLLSSPWRLPRERPEHVCNYYIIKFYSYIQMFLLVYLHSLLTPDWDKRMWWTQDNSCCTKHGGRSFSLALFTDHSNSKSPRR
jgi:hypothetical protein